MLSKRVRNIRTVQNKLIAVLILVICEFLLPVSADSNVDLHWLWDDRCASCHGHSAEFARQFLTVADNKLQGRHHVDDLHRFLGNHYLSGQSVDDIYAMLLAQRQQSARFKNECSRCHQIASSLVREKLIFKDGVLSVKETGTSVSKFLQSHRRLQADDVIFYTELLGRIAREVNLPAQ